MTSRAMRVPNKYESGANYAADMRDHVACLNALDAPFRRSGSREGIEVSECSGARQRAAAPGLVPIENNLNAPVSIGALARPPAGAALIDASARRVKRMRASVEHSMRLSESGLARRGGFRFRRKFVTLTYADVEGWSAEHITEYLRRVSMWAKRRNFKLSYVWVAELQQRGAVHYHVCFWLPNRYRMPESDTQGWWRHGMSNIKDVTGGCSGLMGYMSKYMSKTTASAAMKFPKGARLFGVGGLDQEQRREVRYRLAPFWVRDALGTYADIRRTVGGWCDKFTGEFLRSPWKVFIDKYGFTWAIRDPLTVA